MRDDLVPIELPPGLFRNGTRYQAKDRWYDANLIRFQGPRIQPVGGWRAALSSGGGDLQALTGITRGIHAWSSDNGSVKLGIGTHKRAYALIDGTLTDITPATSFVEGDEDSFVTGGGFGMGTYGVGVYGIGSVIGALNDADTWSLDNFGDFLAGCLTSDRKVLIWDGNTANNFALAAGSPACDAIVVTPERFLFALGAGGNKRKVQWPDRESTTLWTPASTNKAGSYELATNGRLRCGARTTRETLLWTDADMWVATFIGGTLVYSFRSGGEKCGILGPLAKATVDTRAFWMGNGSFFMYDGFARPIPCDVQDHVFADMNELQIAKIWAMTFAEFGEVWWFYCSAGSTEIDRYVVYNYRENHWNVGRLVRTSGIDAGAAPNPVLCELTRSSKGTLTSTGTAPANNDTVTIAAKVYTFQTALTNVDGNVLIGASAATALTNLYNAINLTGVAGTDYATLMTLHPTVEATDKTATTVVVRAKVSGSGGNSIATTETSAQLSWGAATLTLGGGVTGYPSTNVWEHEVANDRGNEVPYVESGPYELAEGNRVMGIYQIVPDEKNVGDVNATLYTSMAVNPSTSQPETANGPYTMGSPTDVRLTARFARIRFTQAVETAWRIGIMRFAPKPKGRR